MKLHRLTRVLSVVLAVTGLAGAAENVSFNLARSASVVNAGCLPEATGRVTINSLGAVESMHVEASGLPANTDFDVFVIQLPNAPFGLAWYQGDLQSNANGKAVADFVGRFSAETFIVAPGSGPAPSVHPADATVNPATAPVHTYHVGIWFDSPTAAGNAGCPSGPTPFNGQHNAGTQVLSSRGFANTAGPLKQIQ
jgi:hypothetical protein